MLADNEIIGQSAFDIRELMRLDAELSLDDLAEIIRKIVESYGLRNAVYHCPAFPGRRVGDPFLALTCETGGGVHEGKTNYVNIDPVFNVGARTVLPVDWATLGRGDRRAVKMRHEAGDGGIGAEGMTIPIRGPENGLWALFSVTSNDGVEQWRQRRRSIVAELVLIAHFIHQKAYQLHQSSEAIYLDAITRRETEALAWTAEGKTVADIAALMRISGETVKAHLDSARFKLNALNRAHAVTKAIRHGIIH
jgi:LuxR family quorum-sensing system transcriptional regulator SinR